MEKGKGINIKLKDVTKLFSSGVRKTIGFTKEYSKEILDNGYKADFLLALNKAGITPNNITTFRIVSLVIGIFVYYLGNPILGLSLMTGSCVLDIVDGKLARRFGQGSIGGENFDAGFDKVTDMSLTGMSIYELAISVSDYITTIYGITGLAKAYYHGKSQFREGRPGLEEQIDTSLQCMVQDEKTKFVKKPSDGAAINPGKRKTFFQFTSGLGILWTGEVDKLINMGIGKDVLDVVFVALSGVSIILAQKSINGGSKNSKS